MSRTRAFAIVVLSLASLTAIAAGSGPAPEIKPQAESKLAERLQNCRDENARLRINLDALKPSHTGNELLHLLATEQIVWEAVVSSRYDTEDEIKVTCHAPSPLGDFNLEASMAGNPGDLTAGDVVRISGEMASFEKGSRSRRVTLSLRRATILEIRRPAG